jgi:hypothetical protein
MRFPPRTNENFTKFESGYGRLTFLAEWPRIEVDAAFFRDFMINMHIPEERFHEVVTAGSALSEPEFAHLDSCEYCIDLFANTARRIIEKRLENRDPSFDVSASER